MAAVPFLAGAGLMAASAPAHAGATKVDPTCGINCEVYETTSITLPRQDTDFLLFMALPQINPAHNGAVTKVVVTLGGSVYGDYYAVNSSKSSGISSTSYVEGSSGLREAQLKATITVYQPDLTITAADLTPTAIPGAYAADIDTTAYEGATALGVTIPVLNDIVRKTADTGGTTTVGNPLYTAPLVKQAANSPCDANATYSAAFIQANCTAGSYQIRSGLQASDTTTTTSRSGSDQYNAIAPYVFGYGSLYIPVTAAANSTFIGSGNVKSSFNTDASATATIAVYYTVVSEPASMSLLGVGMAGLMAARRRRVVAAR